MERNRPIDSDDLVTPVKIAKVLEKSLEDLKRSIELIMKVVEQKDDEDIQCVSCHVCSVGSEQSRIESQPALKQEDRLS